LQRRKFLIGADLDTDQAPDVSWFGPDLAPPDWHDRELRTLGIMLDGGEERSLLGDYRLFLLLHAHHEARPFLLPPPPTPHRWWRVLDTSLPAGQDLVDPGGEVAIDPGDRYVASARSTVLLLAR
jgi:isoamylase